MRLFARYPAINHRVMEPHDTPISNSKDILAGP